MSQTAAVHRVSTRVEPYREHRQPPASALRTLRILANLSISGLARLADIDRQTVRRLEAGTHQPRRRSAENIAAVLGVDVELIFPDGLAATDPSEVGEA